MLEFVIRSHQKYIREHSARGSPELGTGALLYPTQTTSLPSVSLSSSETGRLNSHGVFACIDLFNTYPSPIG